jgi:hypothetical protein
MLGEVFSEKEVEFFTQKMCLKSQVSSPNIALGLTSTVIVRQTPRVLVTAVDCFLGSAEIMYSTADLSVLAIASHSGTNV